jgi:hypothetical protein
MYQNFIIPYLCEPQHVSVDTPPIIRSLKLHWQALVFHTWKVVGRVVGGRCKAQCAWERPPTTRPTTFHVWKTRAWQCSFRLLMMGGVSTEACWGSHKYGIIIFHALLHFVGFFFMNKLLTVKDFAVKTTGASNTRFYGTKFEWWRHAVHFIPNSGSDTQYNSLCGYKIIAGKHTIRNTINH